MFKKFVYVSAIAVITSIMVVQLGYLVRPTDTGGAYDQIETFHSLPANSLDVIVYGSSVAFRGINTLEMSEKYGIAAYNYGYHWQKINTTELFIKDSLMTQQPKVAVIETFSANTVNKGTTISPEIYYSRYIKNSEARSEYLRECFGNDLEAYMSYYVPLWGFHDNWSSLTQQSFSRLKVTGNLKITNGYQPLDRIMKTELLEYDEINQEPLSDAAIDVLDDIVEILHGNNIEVLFVLLPYRTDILYADAIENYAERNNCGFLDLYKNIDVVGIDGETDFYDETHLNNSGATKAADYIGEYIIENYRLTH